MASIQIIVCVMTLAGNMCETHVVQEAMDADTCRRATPIVEMYVERQFRLESGYTGDMIVNATCIPEVSS